MLDNAAFARVIREFLRDPETAGNLRAFYELAFHFTRSYIRILRTRGWRLPVEDFSSETAIDDLTIDLLAPLFASDTGRPCHIITDYLSPRCHTAASDEDVVTFAKALIAGHVRQELTDLVWGRRPEQGRLRRRIREITEGDGYLPFEESGTVMIRWRHAANGPRDEARVIDDGELHAIVLESSSKHSQMPDRCRSVFETLDGMDWLRNAIPRYRLVGVFCRALDELAQTTTPETSSPQADYVRKRARHLAGRAIDDIMQSDFAVFELKKGFDDAMRGKYIVALTRLVDDLIAHGEHDLLPRYLKEQLGEDAGDSYLSVHKHSWETIVKRCLGRLRELLAAEGLEPE